MRFVIDFGKPRAVNGVGIPRRLVFDSEQYVEGERVDGDIALPVGEYIPGKHYSLPVVKWEEL